MRGNFTCWSKNIFSIRTRDGEMINRMARDELIIGFETEIYSLISDLHVHVCSIESVTNSLGH